jgi:hypothetical protein
MANMIAQKETDFFWSRDFSLLLPTVLQDGIISLKEKKDRPWTLLLTNQSRGWCSPRRREITIPTWVSSDKRKESGEFVWYVAHEISHAWDFEEKTYQAKRPHGPSFMKWLKVFCPKEFLFFELGYKPREAAMAGIRKPEKTAEEEFGFDPNNIF